jgi:hypothetical protein
MPQKYALHMYLMYQGEQQKHAFRRRYYVITFGGLRKNMPATVAAPTAPLLKKKINRINLNLSAAARADIDKLATETGNSITELVRLALSLLKVVIEESRKGNKLIITSSDGTPQTQLVIPGL